MCSTMYQPDTLRAQHSAVSTAKHPPHTLVEASTGMPQIQHCLERKEQGKVSNNPVLSVSLSPVPGKLRVPRRVWDKYGGNVGMTSLETGEGDRVSRLFSLSLMPRLL